jgi:ferredoxin
LLRGASGIEIARPSCEGCLLVKAAFHLETVIRKTHHLYDMLGIARDRISLKNIPLQGLVRAPQRAVSRREFFGAFRAKATRIAAAAIPDVEGSGDGKAEVFRNAIQERRENRKRSMLVERLRELGAKSGVNQSAVPSEDSIIADIEVGAGCTACGVCASLCPTGAISQKQTEKTFSLRFSPALCTNCGICEKTCMHRALTMKETVSPALLFQQEETTLFEAERKTCLACRMDFVGEGAEICPLCLDRNKKQTAVLQELFK